MAPKSERFEMRLDEILLNRLDQWRSEHGSVSRAEAVRELVLLGLDHSHRDNLNISDGEKLIIAMLADQRKPAAKHEIDVDEVMEAIYGGHLWALKWEMTGLFHNHVDTPGAVSMVVDTLDMWSFIEEAVEAFSEVERKRLETELGPLGKSPRFAGFDGNYETDYLGIASHLVNRLNRFTRFKGRQLNSHRPVVGRYARMLQVFKPIRSALGDRWPVRMSTDEVIKVLQPSVKPE